MGSGIVEQHPGVGVTDDDAFFQALNDLFEATFERALLDDADGSGANFYGAEFLDARVDRFRGRRMNLAMTKLADTEGAS